MKQLLPAAAILLCRPGYGCARPRSCSLCECAAACPPSSACLPARSQGSDGNEQGVSKTWLAPPLLPDQGVSRAPPPPSSEQARGGMPAPAPAGPAATATTKHKVFSQCTRAHAPVPLCLANSCGSQPAGPWFAAVPSGTQQSCSRLGCSLVAQTCACLFFLPSKFLTNDCSVGVCLPSIMPPRTLPPTLPGVPAALAFRRSPLYL